MGVSLRCLFDIDSLPVPQNPVSLRSTRNPIVKYIRHLKPEAFVNEEGEVFEGPQEPPRFDSPVKLETRGVTEHPTQRDADQFPTWQQELIWAKGTIYKNSIAAKLRSISRTDEATKLEKCHTIYTVAQCSSCKTVKKFPNRCDQLFCPECQPRLSSDRRKAVEWWARAVKQPKHVVLTVQNVPDFTREHVLQFKKWWRNLRRTKFARNWLGGFYSLEVTNEGRGWHLHLHALVDAKWIDALELSAQWAKITGNMGRIVKVRDARGADYLKEVTKYAVKGVQLAAWPAIDIATFIDAFNGPRTFGVFGDLYGKRTEFAEWFKALRLAKPKCECGCCDIWYFTESQFLEKDLRPTIETASLPPPRIDLTIPLPLSFAQCGPK